MASFESWTSPRGMSTSSELNDSRSDSSLSIDEREQLEEDLM